MAKSKYAIIMHCNDEVLRFNTTEGLYDIVRPDLLPYALKNKLRVEPKLTGNQRYDTTQLALFMQNNSNAIVSWLAERTLLLSRKNAKKLYNAYRLVQAQDPFTKAKLSLACRALSILDNYWVKVDTDSTKWEQVNLRENSLSDAVAQIALHGTSLSLDGTPNGTPEFLTNGASAKCWRRYQGKSLWLHKAGDNGTFEAKVEVAVSNILDCCNVQHVHYEKREDNDIYVAACPVMTDNCMSIVDGLDFSDYCTRSGKDYQKELIALDPDGYYKMLIVDYLIANRDRHLQNWGVYYDPSDMHLISMHPLFDHNNAFDTDCMQDENYKSHFGGKTLKENAMDAMKHCDFHFTSDITRDMFVTERQYATFMKRAEQLRVVQKNEDIVQIHEVLIVYRKHFFIDNADLWKSELHRLQSLYNIEDMFTLCKYLKKELLPEATQYEYSMHFEY